MKRIFLIFILVLSVSSHAFDDRFCNALEIIVVDSLRVSFMKDEPLIFFNPEVKRLVDSYEMLYERLLVRKATGHLFEFIDDIEDCDFESEVIKEFNTTDLDRFDISEDLKAQIIEKLSDGEIDSDNLIRNIGTGLISIGGTAIFIGLASQGELFLFPVAGLYLIAVGKVAWLNVAIKNAPASISPIIFKHFDKTNYGKVKRISQGMAIQRVRELVGSRY